MPNKSSPVGLDEMRGRSQTEVAQEATCRPIAILSSAAFASTRQP